MKFLVDALIAEVNRRIFKFDFFQVISSQTIPYRGLLRFILIYSLEVRDQTKIGFSDDPCEGFSTTTGKSLVFGLTGLFV